MKKTLAICAKQLNDTWHNKSVLLQFVLLPMLALLMGQFMSEESMPRQSMAAMFTTMYVGMIPMSCMTAIIAEEREKGTLRCLRMANVSARQYLLGIGSCLLLESLFGVAIFSVLGGYTGNAWAEFVIIAVMGVLTSLMLGAAIGLLAKNQMSATSLSAPIGVALSFIPTLAAMNESVSRVSRYLYTQQLQRLMDNIGNVPFTTERLGIVAANLALFALAFGVIYHKKGLRDQ